MQPWIEAAFVKYGWIWIGLSFGFLAKYALLIKRGVPVQARLIFADILLLPAVALIAYWGVTKVGLVGETAALAACFCTVGADRLMKLMTERFFARVEALTLRDVAKDVVESRGELRNAVQTVRSARDLTDPPAG